MMDNNNQKMADALAGQFPYRLNKSDLFYCEWLQNTPQNFTEPFFDETISRLRYAYENQRSFKTLAHIDMLEEWAGHLPHKTPAAIIFHVSRCGSTLFSQLLSLQQQNMVLAEVPFFDELLRLPFKDAQFSKDKAGKLFNAALQLYVNSSAQKPAYVFIKADSWHLHFYEQLRLLYPDSPFILLYRNPLEVLNSQQKRRGIQSVPGMIEPDVFNFTAAQSAEYDLDKYMANVLQTYFEKMIHIAGVDNNSILINYSEPAMNSIEKILTSANISMEQTHRHQMQERCGFHAKYPQQLFEEDRMNDPLPDYMQQHMKLYQQLDAIRLAAV